MTSLSNSRIIIGARTCGKYRAEVRSPLERAGKTTDMAESKAWTTKRKMKARSAKLVATRQARASAETHRRAVDPTSHAESHTSPSSPTESVQREPDPQTSQETSQDAPVVSVDLGVGGESEYESDARAFDGDAAQDVFDDFVLSLPLDDRRMLAVLLMESFINRQKMQVVDAAREAGSIVGYTDRTVRTLRKQFWDNNGMLEERKQGKYARMTVYGDEELNKKAAEWVRANAFRKGQPNMTAQSFCVWVNEDLLPSSHLLPHFPRRVSFRTSVRWLYHLGFKPVSHRKGVYIDGHEREDVVLHRGKYLREMAALRSSHQPPPACSDEEPRIRVEDDDEKKTLVILYHDESIYNSNEGQTWMWGEEERPALLPKTKGSGVMVSDFVDKHDGYLRLTDKQFALAKVGNPTIAQTARVTFLYGSEREGYWTGEKFMKQMATACDIASFKYPPHSHSVVFILDQSSCHRKFEEMALIPRNILVKDGGPRRVRDTAWAGRPQSMVLHDGTAKGLRTILRERGINTGTLKADDMRTILANHDDFVNEKTQVEHEVNRRGLQCFFIPKFHCELNPIERVWGQSKRYCRAYTNFTIAKLREIIDPALDSVNVELIRKYFRKVREYEKAYLEGKKAGKEVEAAVKVYKSHRRVFSENI